MLSQVLRLQLGSSWIVSKLSKYISHIGSYVFTMKVCETFSEKFTQSGKCEKVTDTSSDKGNYVAILDLSAVEKKRNSKIYCHFYCPKCLYTGVSQFLLQGIVQITFGQWRM